MMNADKEGLATDFHESVNLALAELPGNQELAAAFLSGEKGRQRYVIGKNEQSAALIGLVDIAGVLDDYETRSVQWNGVPVVHTSAIESDAIVVNCSTSIAPVSVQRALSNAGLKNVLPVFEVIHAAHGSLALPWFVRQQREDYLSHQEEWGNVYASLADDESRQTFLDVVRYRLTADPRYMGNYRVRLNEQYFEDFLHLQAEVFVDAGGFDGDTTEEFCKRFPDYRKVILFEPSLKNMIAAKARLAAFRDIDFIRVGLSDGDGQLHFNPDAGSASAVSDAGNETIEVTTLDKAVGEPVSFIKMDLEGWETRALAGCARHIVSDRPKLALSVYHAAKDFREIHRDVLALDPGYRIHLRHYTEGWSETVMYFV
jgi:FkbM family methyltransferase